MARAQGTGSVESREWEGNQWQVAWDLERFVGNLCFNSKAKKETLKIVKQDIPEQIIYGDLQAKEPLIWSKEERSGSQRVIKDGEFENTLLILAVRAEQHRGGENKLQSELGAGCIFHLP